MKTFIVRLIADRALVYDRFTYPAGETQVRLKPEVIDGIKESEAVNIVARIHGAEDIIELAMLRDAIFGLEYDGNVNVVLPYLPYSRADRRFTKGDCHGLWVFLDFLRSMGWDRIITLDVHSDEADKLNGNVTNISARPFIERAIGEFAKSCGTNEIVVLFPDKGAADRYKIADRVGCNVEVVDVRVLFAEKLRDPVTGKFGGFTVPGAEAYGGRPILIVDDICDGGGTFLGISALLPFDQPLGLYVTHGIFSKGFSELNMQFDQIYTTNSFGGPGLPKSVQVFDVIGTLLGECR